MTTMRGFMVTLTGPNGEQSVRWFPTIWCADGALAWAKLLRSGWTADTTQAKKAQAQCRRRRKQMEAGK